MCCHGGIEVDVNGTWPEKAWRARENAACWHYQHNMPYFALAVFVMPARSGAINVVADALVHFLRGLVSAWLNCVALMRNLKWKKLPKSLRVGITSTISKIPFRQFRERFTNLALCHVIFWSAPRSMTFERYTTLAHNFWTSHDFVIELFLWWLNNQAPEFLNVTQL